MHLRKFNLILGSLLKFHACILSLFSDESCGLELLSSLMGSGLSSPYTLLSSTYICTEHKYRSHDVTLLTRIVESVLLTFKVRRSYSSFI